MWTLDAIAASAQIAGRDAVRDAMEARERYSPWEITEAWIKIAIARRWLEDMRKSSSEKLRVFDEFFLTEIANIAPVPHELRNHRVDIALLYPLLRDAVGSSDPWAQANQCAVGLVEIKKEWGCAVDDARLLNRISCAEGVERPLKWELLAVFINGASEDEVIKNEAEVARSVYQYGFVELTKQRPEEPPLVSRSTKPVQDRWFDFMCYGKSF